MFGFKVAVKINLGERQYPLKKEKYNIISIKPGAAWAGATRSPNRHRRTTIHIGERNPTKIRLTGEGKTSGRLFLLLFKL